MESHPAGSGATSQAALNSYAVEPQQLCPSPMVCRRGRLWDLSFSLFLLMTFLVFSPTVTSFLMPMTPKSSTQRRPITMTSWCCSLGPRKTFDFYNTGSVWTASKWMLTRPALCYSVLGTHLPRQQISYLMLVTSAFDLKRKLKFLAFSSTRPFPGSHMWPTSFVEPMPS